MQTPATPPRRPPARRRASRAAGALLAAALLATGCADLTCNELGWTREVRVHIDEDPRRVRMTGEWSCTDGDGCSIALDENGRFEVVWPGVRTARYDAGSGRLSVYENRRQRTVEYRCLTRAEESLRDGLRRLLRGRDG